MQILSALLIGSLTASATTSLGSFKLADALGAQDEMYAAARAGDAMTQIRLLADDLYVLARVQMGANTPLKINADAARTLSRHFMAVTKVVLGERLARSEGFSDAEQLRALGVVEQLTWQTLDEEFGPAERAALKEVFPQIVDAIGNLYPRAKIHSFRLQVRFNGPGASAPRWVEMQIPLWQMYWWGAQVYAQHFFIGRSKAVRATWLRELSLAQTVFALSRYLRQPVRFGGCAPQLKAPVPAPPRNAIR